MPTAWGDDTEPAAPPRPARTYIPPHLRGQPNDSFANELPSVQSSSNPVSDWGEDVGKIPVSSWDSQEPTPAIPRKSKDQATGSSWGADNSQTNEPFKSNYDTGFKGSFGGRDQGGYRGGGRDQGGGSWGGDRRGGYGRGRPSGNGYVSNSSNSGTSDGNLGKSGWNQGKEENPFKESVPPASKPDETIFAQENTGINFEAYEDIPVETSGENVPPPILNFTEAGLGPEVDENIRRCKYINPTPVQKHAIPISLAGRDLMACAQTGSGKTAAFCFPIISGILRVGPPADRPRERKAHPLALILSPTRELACQIYEEARKFSYQTGLRAVVVYGGSPINNQLREMERGVDILVATPGRLSDLLERARVSLSLIRYLALDEADRMLDMGFEPQIRRIVDGGDMPPVGERQTLLFSATFPKEIQRLAADFLHNYVFLAVGRVGSSTDLIQQRVEYVQESDKRSVLMDLIHAHHASSGTHTSNLTLVFVETKRGADALEDWLCRNNFPAAAIHGDRTQYEREQALHSFKKGKTPILVATDVAARGLDIPNVSHVINYDLPGDIDDYVHRIGRTGRAGKKGLATAFFCDKNQNIARSLVELMQESNQEVPAWLSQFGNRPSYGGGSKRTGGGSKFGGRDYRKDGGRSGGYGDAGYGGRGGYGGSGSGGYGGGYGGYSDNAYGGSNGAYGGGGGGYGGNGGYNGGGYGGSGGYGGGGYGGNRGGYGGNRGGYGGGGYGGSAAGYGGGSGSEVYGGNTGGSYGSNDSFTPLPNPSPMSGYVNPNANAVADSKVNTSAGYGSADYGGTASSAWE